MDLAVLAVRGSGRPLDVGVGDPDTSPTSLGIPAPEEPNTVLISSVCVRFVWQAAGTQSPVITPVFRNGG